MDFLFLSWLLFVLAIPANQESQPLIGDKDGWGITCSGDGRVDAIQPCGVGGVTQQYELKSFQTCSVRSTSKQQKDKWFSGRNPVSGQKV
jgi:hypothetical protein